jgi:twitching motility two-component system response regulator PilG
MSAFFSQRSGENQDDKLPGAMLPGADMQDCAAELSQTCCAGAAKESAKHSKSHGGHFPERRARRRAVISAPVRVRSLDLTRGGPDEATTTLDVSRNGLLVSVRDKSFYRGMDVAVTFPYTRTKGVTQAEQRGRVMRVHEVTPGQYSVAIALNAGVGDEIVDATGNVLQKAPERSWEKPNPDSKKPLVLVVDADAAIRITVKTNLESEGYDVVAVSTSDEAHEVLNLMTPTLVLSEIEGTALPGYELCAFIKGTPRLQTVPVVLMTSSAYPTDYANAHSLGAVVCMAKPFRQERLSNVIRLLAPTPQAKAQCTPTNRPDATRKPDTARKTGAAATTESVAAKKQKKRFFGW